MDAIETAAFAIVPTPEHPPTPTPADEPRRTLRLLAEGIDPLTGAPLEGAGPLQQPDVIRALFRAVELLGTGPAGASRERRRPRREAASGEGSRWTAEEEQRLVEAFDRGTGLDELAALHRRTPGAIRSRLVRLGKIEDEWRPGRRHA